MLGVPDYIQSVWEKFDDFPMETLTKFWIHLQEGGGRQREVTEMREHRDKYGILGNYFDLSLWLLDEFDHEGISAYPTKPQPLLECRIPYKLSVAHWEFFYWESFFSTDEGLIKEPALNNVDQWVEKLHFYTRYNKQFLEVVLKEYEKLAQKR